ncbi:MAG: hypothetical protein ACTSX8_05845 [Alphaproteobacteria bacterium]
MSEVKMWDVRDVDDSRNIVLMDLDGTLAAPIVGDFNPAVIGEPNQNVVAAMARMREAGYRVVIWTCRTSSFWNRSAIYQVKLIHEWMEKHGIDYDGILGHDKPLWSHYLCDNSFNADDWHSMLTKAGIPE